MKVILVFSPIYIPIFSITFFHFSSAKQRIDRKIIHLWGFDFWHILYGFSSGELSFIFSALIFCLIYYYVSCYFKKILISKFQKANCLVCWFFFVFTLLQPDVFQPVVFQLLAFFQFTFIFLVFLQTFSLLIFLVFTAFITIAFSFIFFSLFTIKFLFFFIPLTFSASHFL